MHTCSFAMTHQETWVCAQSAICRFYFHFYLFISVLTWGHFFITSMRDWGLNPQFRCVCAMTRNWTCNFLAYGTTLQALSHSSQGYFQVVSGRKLQPYSWLASFPFNSGYLGVGLFSWYLAPVNGHRQLWALQRSFPSVVAETSYSCNYSFFVWSFV